MSDAPWSLILAEVRELRAKLEAKPRSDGEAEAHARGLLSYEDLQDRLTVGRKKPRRPCERTVKTLAAKYAHILRPVPISSRVVGFRETRVEALLAHLAGDPVIGGAKL